MLRRKFIKNILGLGTLLSVPVFTFLGVSAKQRSNPESNTIEIPVYDCYIRGMHYYEGKDHLERIKPGDELDLIRQPENEHDTNAIEVFWDGYKMGYLPREDNLVLANILDKGIPLKSRVIEVFPQNEIYEKCRIKVTMLIPGFRH